MINPRGDYESKNPQASVSLLDTIQRLDPTVGELHSVIDDVLKRLEPLARPIGPEISGAAAGPMALSPLGDHTLNQVRRIEAATYRLRDLLRRLDL